MLHGKRKAGFEALIAELNGAGLAKWTLATVFPSYFRPKKEVFIKPTTAKLIVDKLDLNLSYHPKPTWEFYRDFRKAILAARSNVSETLAPNNLAFCGFLMIALKES